MRDANFHDKMMCAHISYSEEYGMHMLTYNRGALCEPAFQEYTVNTNLVELFSTAPLLYQSISRACEQLSIVRNMLESGASRQLTLETVDIIEKHLTETLLFPRLGQVNAMNLIIKEQRGKFKNG